MVIKQLSVFVENREGRLEQVTGILAESGIHITSLSLADTTEYGMLRMIVANPEEAKKVLKQQGLSVMLTDVLAVRLPNQMGTLHKLLLEMRGINIEYMYALSTGEDASMILKVTDVEAAYKKLEKNGFALMGKEAYSING